MASSTIEVGSHWNEDITPNDVACRPVAAAVGILAARVADLLSGPDDALPFSYRSGFRRAEVTEGTWGEQTLPRIRREIRDPDGHFGWLTMTNEVGLVGPDESGQIYFERSYPLVGVHQAYNIDTRNPNNSVGAIWQTGQAPEALPIGEVLSNVTELTNQLVSPYTGTEYKGWQTAGQPVEDVFIHPALQGLPAAEQAK